MQIVSSSSGCAGSGVPGNEAENLGGASLEFELCDVGEVCLDIGFASSVAGERYLNCGGLRAGVGRPFAG